MGELSTRKRRRMARKLMKESPLFAFDELKRIVPDYDEKTFARDTRPTKGFRKKGGKDNLRKEIMRSMYQRFLYSDENKNKLAQAINTHLENISKPLPIQRRFGDNVCTFLFPNKQGHKTGYINLTRKLFAAKDEKEWNEIADQNRLL